MSRSVGLPCRTSPDTDQSSVSRLVRFRRSTASRVFRAASGGLVSLSLLSLLGVPSARPVASERVAPAAASFAAAGFVGLTGDASGIDDAAFTGFESIGGTLAFGDPIVPPITVPSLPGFPITPPSEDAPAAPTDIPPAPPEPEPTVPPPVDESHPPSEPTPPPVEEAPPVEAAPPPAEETPPPPPAETPPPPAETPPPAEAPAGDAARGTQASNFAHSLVGKPYRYGAAGPNSFDCSGLTMYVYSKFGVKLPHKASQQFSSRYGRVIGSMSDLQAGDLVFFKNTAGRGITHTAIYVGGGKMVSANTPRTGVQLNSIGESYWRKHWAGGLRLN
jgi:cell wall-associated NlpC family hydrolase